MKPRIRERERLPAAIMEDVIKHAIINCVVERKFDPYPRTVAHLRPLFDARDAGRHVGCSGREKQEGPRLILTLI
jgi:hypothetical protein